MRVTKGKSNYPVPKDYGGAYWPFIEDAEGGGPLRRLEESDMAPGGQFANLPPGRPIGVCIAAGRVVVWPKPDKTYTVVIEYCPENKEF